MTVITCPACKREQASAGGICSYCGAVLGPRPPGGEHLKTHTWLAAALLVGSYFGLVSSTDTRAAGAGVTTVVFGALLLVAVIYYVEVRLRSRGRHRQ